MTTTINNEHKKLNFSSEREQSQACLNSAEHEKNQGRKVLNVPNLRFPKFQGEWETSLLSKYLTENKERNKKGYFDKTDVLSVSGDFGIVNQIKLLGRSFAGASVFPYHIVRHGNIVYTKSPLKEYPYGIVKTNSGEDGIVSTLYAVYNVNDNAYDKFIEFYFSLANRTNRYFKPIVRIGAKHDMKIGNQEVLENNVVFPAKQEQVKIASFLSLIDERIATQSKVIDKLQSLIRGLRCTTFSHIRKTAGTTATIGEILQYEQPQDYIVTNTEYSSDGIPVLTANKAFILGYTNENFGIYEKGDCVIFDDFTLDCKYVNFPFKVKSSAIKILTSKNRLLLRYAFEYLKYLCLSTDEHKRHYIAETQYLPIPLAEHYTTEKVSSMFEILSTRMDIAYKIKKGYEEQKQYLLRQMFI